MADSLQRGRSIGLMEVPFLLLSAATVAVLIGEGMVDKGTPQAQLLRGADTCLCVMFGIELAFQLWKKGPSRWRYLFKSPDGWASLVSIIPANFVYLIPSSVMGVMPPFVRDNLFRYARFGRFTRLGRAFKAVKMAAANSLSPGKEATLLTTAIFTFFLVVGGAIFVLEFENKAGPADRGVTQPATIGPTASTEGAKASPGSDKTLVTAGDAVWWAVAMISEVGSDFAPQTFWGRVVGVVLMAAGVGVFSIGSGLMAAVFLGMHPDNVEVKGVAADKSASAESVDRLMAEVVALRAELASTRSVQRPPDIGGGAKDPNTLVVAAAAIAAVGYAVANIRSRNAAGTQ